MSRLTCTALRWFRQAQAKLRRQQRHVSRCPKRTQGWRKACRQVALLPKRVFNQRHDFQHKLSREIIHAKGMMRWRI